MAFADEAPPLLRADEAPPSLRIRRVLLRGFKSYRDAVSAGPLDERMTTVVGPNGSGKSCLVEGICFALGVGSQQLRASTLSLRAVGVYRGPILWLAAMRFCPPKPTQPGCSIASVFMPLARRSPDKL